MRPPASTAPSAMTRPCSNTDSIPAGLATSSSTPRKTSSSETRPRSKCAPASVPTPPSTNAISPSSPTTQTSTPTPSKKTATWANTPLPSSYPDLSPRHSRPRSRIQRGGPLTLSQTRRGGRLSKARARDGGSASPIRHASPIHPLLPRHSGRREPEPISRGRAAHPEPRRRVERGEAPNCQSVAFTLPVGAVREPPHSHLHPSRGEPVHPRRIIPVTESRYPSPAGPLTLSNLKVRLWSIEGSSGGRPCFANTSRSPPTSTPTPCHSEAPRGI